MATGLQRPLRRAILSTLKASAPLTAEIPAARIYPQAVPGNPVWPFAKLGPPVSLRIRAACVRGDNISLDVHAFTRGTAGETAEDHAGRIGGLIEAALDDRTLTLEGGATARIRLTDKRLFQDAEPDAFHYLCQVNARVLAS